MRFRQRTRVYAADAALRHAAEVGYAAAFFTDRCHGFYATLNSDIRRMPT